MGHSHLPRFVVAALLLVGLAGPAIQPVAAAAAPAERMVLAVIGDYGVCYRSGPACSDETSVAAMVHAWNPDAVITVGDNTYKAGSCSEVAGDGHRPPDSLPYLADIRAGRFYQVTGDHDWGSGQAGIDCATRFFGRPTHYTAHLGGGLLDLFVVDMNRDHGSKGTQAVGYRRDVAASNAVWKVTADHQPFYGSGVHGTSPATHWAILPTIDLFLSGHDADLEHLQLDGQNYVVNGAGGDSLGRVSCCVTGSLWHESDQHGAVRLTVTADSLTVEFLVLSKDAAGGRLVHSFQISHLGTAGGVADQAQALQAARAGSGEGAPMPPSGWAWTLSLGLVALGFALGSGCLLWAVSYGIRNRHTSR